MSKSKKVLIPLSMFKKVIDNKQSYIFRSKLEANFAFLFDSLPAVLKWNYESISVSYFLSTDKKYHQYILDFTLETIDNKVMLIEIKPNSKLNKNLQYTNEDKLEYIKNQSKWQAAKEYCDKNNLMFRIMTEKDLPVKSKRY